MIKLLDKLKGGALHAYVRGMIPKFFKKGFTRSGALKWLKEKGRGVRKKKFLEYWSQITGIAQKKDPLKHVRKKYFPEDYLVQLTHDKQRKQYKYVYKATIRDLLTREDKIQFISLESDYKKPLGLVDEMAAVIATSYKYGEQIVLSSLERDSILRRVK